MLRRLVVRIMLVGTVGLTVATVPILPAFAQPTVTLHVGQPGTLVARGAAVEVPLDYSCSADATFASLNLSITERVGGNETATGSGFTSELTCDGSEHTALVVATPTNGGSGNAFRKGEALAQGHLLGCDPSGFPCGEVSSDGVIQIVKP